MPNLSTKRMGVGRARAPPSLVDPVVAAPPVKQKKCSKETMNEPPVDKKSNTDIFHVMLRSGCGKRMIVSRKAAQCMRALNEH